MSDPVALAARLDDNTARVAVIGLGYVGLPVATRAAEIGYDVVGYDVSDERVSALARGISYVEDIRDEVVVASLAAGFRPTTDPSDLDGFDVAIITVPTPLREGNPDLSYVEDAGRSVAAALRPGALVVLESTTYPGTTTELLGPILEEVSGLRAGHDFFLGYSPERIDPGNTTWNLVTTPKVVSGIDEASTQLVASFYGSIVDKVIVMGSTAEAELVKLLENTFRHVNIALVNEIAMFAGSLGVNVWNVIDAASTKPYGYMRFTPGPGVGGHCLPIDPSYLSWQVKRRSGRSFRFVELANDVNEHMPDHVVSRLITMLNHDGRSVRDARFLLLGVAYKASTSDFRESPSLQVADALRALGGDVSACDPHVTELDRERLGIPLVELSAEALAASDVVVILVDHPEFDPEMIARHAPLVFDAKGILRNVDFAGELL